MVEILIDVQAISDTGTISPSVYSYSDDATFALPNNTHRVRIRVWIPLKQNDGEHKQ